MGGMKEYEDKLNNAKKTLNSLRDGNIDLDDFEYSREILAPETLGKCLMVIDFNNLDKVGISLRVVNKKINITDLETEIYTLTNIKEELIRNRNKYDLGQHNSVIKKDWEVGLGGGSYLVKPKNNEIILFDISSRYDEMHLDLVQRCFKGLQTMTDSNIFSKLDVSEYLIERIQRVDRYKRL